MAETGGMVLQAARTFLSGAGLLALVPHALAIAVIIFVGLVAAAVVGGLLSEVALLRSVADLLEETLRLTAVVTAVLYALRAAD